MKETNHTYTQTYSGADYLNDGPPRAEFIPDGETAFVPVNGKSGLLAGAALVGVGLFSILAPGAAGPAGCRARFGVRSAGSGPAAPPARCPGTCPARRAGPACRAGAASCR